MEQIIAIIVFVVVMALVMSERVHRTAAALSGAVVLMLTHILTVEDAVGYIDFNTLGVLVGMMIFVGVVKNSGLFEYVSIRAAKLAHGDPWKIMISFIILTAFLSGFLDNVTTVLLIGPMTISITKMLDLNPVPFLMTQIFASNIGGTGTLIGDPPNIMIGSAAGLNFVDFLANTGIVAVVVTVALILVMKIVYGKNMHKDEIAVARIMSLDEKKAIADRGLLKKSIVMILLVVVGFVAHSSLGIESSVVALTAAAVMLVIGGQNVDHVISEAEWTTIMFFIGLFIVVGGLVETGVIGKLAHVIISTTEGHPVFTMLLLLWASALLSSVLDNIPFVATLIPLVLAMGESGVDTAPLWWAISLGACLGGNGTLIGASANVVLSGISGKHGYPITYKEFLKIGFPVMIMSVIIATAFLMIRYA